MSFELSTDRTELEVGFQRPGAGTIAVITFCGEIDRVTCGEVVAAVITTLRRDEPRRISLDLSEVTFLDSGGIRALVASLEEARRLGCELEIRQAHTNVHQVLSITGLVEEFHLGPS